MTCKAPPTHNQRGLWNAFHSYFHPVREGVSVGIRSSRGNSPRTLDSIARISAVFPLFTTSISSAERALGSSFLLASRYNRGSTACSMSMASFIFRNLRSVSAARCWRTCRRCSSHARSIVSCACTEGMARCIARPTSGRQVPMGVDRFLMLPGYSTRRMMSFLGSPAVLSWPGAA